MKTEYWTVDFDMKSQESLANLNSAAKCLNEGEVVAFPTETVYGLGADATNEAAVEKIFIAKGRPQDNPLIVHVAHVDQLKPLVTEIPDYVHDLLSIYSPGPLTYILKASDKIARNVTAGLDTVAVRIPDHPVARALIQASNLPLAAPSANISGKPSPTTAAHVKTDLSGRVSGIIDSGQHGVGIESTVVDCTGLFPVILRPGAVTEEMLAVVTGQVGSDPALKDTNAAPKSPGMKYRHYAPDVPLWLVSGDAREIQTVIDEAKDAYLRIGVLVESALVDLIEADYIVSLGAGLTEITRHIYDRLRHFQREDVDLIICQSFAEVGLGIALMNRLNKAASRNLTTESSD